MLHLGLCESGILCRVSYQVHEYSTDIEVATDHRMAQNKLTPFSSFKLVVQQRFEIEMSQNNAKIL